MDGNACGRLPRVDGFRRTGVRTFNTTSVVAFAGSTLDCRADAMRSSSPLGNPSSLRRPLSSTSGIPNRSSAKSVLCRNSRPERRRRAFCAGNPSLNAEKERSVPEIPAGSSRKSVVCRRSLRDARRSAFGLGIPSSAPRARRSRSQIAARTLILCASLPIVLPSLAALDLFFSKPTTRAEPCREERQPEAMSPEGTFVTQREGSP